MVTVFGPPGRGGQPANIAVRKLNRGELPSNASAPEWVRSVAAPAASVGAKREIATEIVAHIERKGDALLPGSGWIGDRGSKLRIEGFSILARAGISSEEIEYKTLHPGKVETAWIAGPRFCGSKGRGMPIIGFAVRVGSHLRERVTVEYCGAFFNSGISGPHRDGEPCLPRVPGDPLESLNIRLTWRAY
jgi:hypothetical protein